MVQYASTMPEYALMSLNMAEHVWILLNVPEYARRNCARVLNMPHHLWYLTEFWTCLLLSMPMFWICCHIIIIIQLIHNYFIFFNTSWNIRITKVCYTFFLVSNRQKLILYFFFFITITSELSKYLNEQLSTFLNVKQQKWSYQKT